MVNGGKRKISLPPKVIGRRSRGKETKEKGRGRGGRLPKKAGKFSAGKEAVINSRGENGTGREEEEVTVCDARKGRSAFNGV